MRKYLNKPCARMQGTENVNVQWQMNRFQIVYKYISLSVSF